MAETVYLLCAVMSILCTLFLFRGYRKSANKLLLWTALSFALMACNNIFLYIDLAMFPNMDLHGPFWRNLLGTLSGATLLFGLIWELT
ncbi:MAG: hypothetical protein JSU04_19725 [Bdellovibrionales bacterium]|nr:hypothetical protein [Bdellovibrionales bacterium]